MSKAMRGTSAPGKTKAAPGFIVADVMAAIVIAAIALSAILTAVIHATRLAAGERDRIVKIVEKENVRASNLAQVLDLEK